MPAISVMAVGIKEAPHERGAAASVDGGLLCQTALEAAYLALVPELSKYGCTPEVVAAVETLAPYALSLPHGTIRQLMCLVVKGCVEAARGSGGPRCAFAAPDVLTKVLLLRVDDSKDDVRVEALGCLTAIVEACLMRRSVKCEGDVLARVEERAREILESHEEEQVREAVVALQVALAAAK